MPKLKSTAVPLLPLWTFVACSRVNYTFTFWWKITAFGAECVCLISCHEDVNLDMRYWCKCLVVQGFQWIMWLVDTSSALQNDGLHHVLSSRSAYCPFIVPQIQNTFFFSTYIPCILILSKLICLPTDALLNCRKNNFKIYLKIDVKTAATCFGVITIIRERTIRSC